MLTENSRENITDVFEAKEKTGTNAKNFRLFTFHAGFSLVHTHLQKIIPLNLLMANVPII